MENKPTQILFTFMCLLLVVLVPAGVIFAQGGEFQEDFEDGSLEGWEHSEGVIISEGSLQIPPDNFAVRFEGLPGTAFAFDFKRSGSGALIFRYSISPQGEYALILHDKAAVLEKGGEGPPEMLDESPWSPDGDQWQSVQILMGPSGQQISIGNESILSTQEENLLQGGGVGFWVEGEGTASLDNLVISGSEPPGESQQGLPSTGEADTQSPDPTPGTAQESEVSVRDLIRELTSAQTTATDLTTFLINLGLSVVLSYILSRVYVHWGSSLSNRRRFAANFILITVTTTFIILVVRSSVALSLGLVGALSIVRFRSAIKEPEELAYLFFAIAIGIGLGDNQRMITVIALAAAILVLGIMRAFRGRQADFNLHLTVTSIGSSPVGFEKVVDTLKKNSSQLKLIRLDESQVAQEIAFLVEFRNMDQFQNARTALQDLSADVQISFLDNKGIW
jgi:hypothetical protein